MKIVKKNLEKVQIVSVCWGKAEKRGFTER